MSTREEVLAELKTLVDPVSGQDIVSAGMVRALSVEDGTVRFFAPVFEGAVYRFATPLEDYAGRFEAAPPDDFAAALAALEFRGE